MISVGGRTDLTLRGWLIAGFGFILRGGLILGVGSTEDGSILGGWAHTQGWVYTVSSHAWKGTCSRNAGSQHPTTRPTM